MKFQSNYAIGDLIEYILDRNDEHTLFGHVTEVIFYQPTQAHSVQYTVQRVNPEGLVDRGVYEHNVKKMYMEVDHELRPD